MPTSLFALQCHHQARQTFQQRIRVVRVPHAHRTERQEVQKVVVEENRQGHLMIRLLDLHAFQKVQKQYWDDVIGEAMRRVVP